MWWAFTNYASSYLVNIIAWSCAGRPEVLWIQLVPLVSAAEESTPGLGLEESLKYSVKPDLAAVYINSDIR